MSHLRCHLLLSFRCCPLDSAVVDGAVAAHRYRNVIDLVAAAAAEVAQFSSGQTPERSPTSSKLWGPLTERDSLPIDSASLRCHYYGDPFQCSLLPQVEEVAAISNYRYLILIGKRFEQSELQLDANNRN